MRREAPAAFEREMACTEADWLRWLPAAVGDHPVQHGERTALIAIGAGRLQLQWRVEPPRTIALMRLPRLHVRFAFEDVDAPARGAFMERFDLYLQRGGG